MTQQTFIYIHGAGMNSGVWRDLAALLPGNHVFIDLPGHGAQKGPALPTIDEMAVWVSQIMREHKNIVLIGHSMGALVALAAAAIAPVQALVLLSANAQMPVNPQLLQTATQNPDEAAGMILKWGIAKTAPSFVREKLEPMMKTTAPGVLASDLAACNEWQKTVPLAKEIKGSVLVLAGAEDKMTPSAKADDLATLFLRGKSIALSGAGHMLMVENPKETARLILDFI